jgi:hypothetical protein
MRKSRLKKSDKEETFFWESNHTVETNKGIERGKKKTIEAATTKGCRKERKQDAVWKINKRR